MIASIGMPASIIVPTNALFTAVSAGDSTCSTAEVEHRFLPRGQLDRALPQATDRLRDPEHALVRATGDVAVHADRGDEPDALLVAAPDLRAEHARRDHAEVAVDREAVERERVAARDDRAPVGPAAERERRDHVVGNEDAHDRRVVRGFELGDLETVVDGLARPFRPGARTPSGARRCRAG